MTIREHELRARRFELDEKRRKLRDLCELKRHLETSLERLSKVPVGGQAQGGLGDGAESAEERRQTLLRSLEDISRKIGESESELDAGRESLERQELVHSGYDRVPVAVGSRRGRGQVEHIRIVRTQR